MLTYSLLLIVPGDHPAAGHFTSLGSSFLLSFPWERVVRHRQLNKSPFPAIEAWKQGALGTVNRILREPLALKVVNVVGGGRDQDWALVELEANAVCKNGKNLFFTFKTIGN